MAAVAAVVLSVAVACCDCGRGVASPARAPRRHPPRRCCCCRRRCRRCRGVSGVSMRGVGVGEGEGEGRGRRAVVEKRHEGGGGRGRRRRGRPFEGRGDGSQYPLGAGLGGLLLGEEDAAGAGVEEVGECVSGGGWIWKYGPRQGLEKGRIGAEKGRRRSKKWPGTGAP